MSRKEYLVMKKMVSPIRSILFSVFYCFPLGCKDNDQGMRGGPSSCAELAQLNPNGDDCAPDHELGKHCMKSCGTCGKIVIPTFLILY